MCNCKLTYYMVLIICLFFFYFNDTAHTEIYTLSLHDALPISIHGFWWNCSRYAGAPAVGTQGTSAGRYRDRKSTRLNSSHVSISYAVFCLKKKKIYLIIFLILD